MSRPFWLFSIEPKIGHFSMIWKKKFPKVTGTTCIKYMLSKYIIILGFRPHFSWKCPIFSQKQWFLVFHKIHIIGCFLGLWSRNLSSNTSFMIYLTIRNVLPVKNKMKNVFLRNSYFHHSEPTHTLLFSPATKSSSARLWVLQGAPTCIYVV